MAKTVGTINYGTTFGQGYDDCIHRVFDLTNVTDGDSYDTGYSECKGVAWESTAVTDIVAVTEAAGTVTFNTAGVTILNGKLHVWSKAY